MAWFRIDDSFCDHPMVVKLWSICPGAVGLYVKALSYSARHELDGVIPALILPMLSPDDSGRRQQVDALLSTGAWQQSATGDSYILGRFHEPAGRKYLPQRLRDAVIDRDGMVCQLCGGEIAEGELHIDHVLPVSLGGPDTLDNLQAAHATCNIRKGANV